MIQFLKTHWQPLVIFGLIAFILIQGRCEADKISKAQQQVVKSEIKAIDNAIKSNTDAQTKIKQDLSSTGKQAVKKADKLKDKAYEKSTVADTTRIYKFAFLTRK